MWGERKIEIIESLPKEVQQARIAMGLIQYVLIYSGRGAEFFEGEMFNFWPFYNPLIDKRVEVPYNIRELIRVFINKFGKENYYKINIREFFGYLKGIINEVDFETLKEEERKLLQKQAHHLLQLYERYKTFIPDEPSEKPARGFMKDFIDFVSKKFRVERNEENPN